MRWGLNLLTHVITLCVNCGVDHSYIDEYCRIHSEKDEIYDEYQVYFDELYDFHTAYRNFQRQFRKSNTLEKFGLTEEFLNRYVKSPTCEKKTDLHVRLQSNLSIVRLRGCYSRKVDMLGRFYFSEKANQGLNAWAKKCFIGKVQQEVLLLIQHNSQACSSDVLN